MRLSPFLVSARSKMMNESTVGKLEGRRDEFGGERIGRKWATGGTEFTLAVKESVNNTRGRRGGAVIFGRGSGTFRARIVHGPSKLKEITEVFVVVRAKAMPPLQNVEFRGCRDT